MASFYYSDKMDPGSVAGLLSQAGFSQQAIAQLMPIAQRESGFNPGAHRTSTNQRGARSGDMGLFQINWDAHGEQLMRAGIIRDYRDLFNPAVNARAAYYLSGGGNPQAMRQLWGHAGGQWSASGTLPQPWTNIPTGGGGTGGLGQGVGGGGGLPPEVVDYLTDLGLDPGQLLGAAPSFSDLAGLQTGAAFTGMQEDFARQQAGFQGQLLGLSQQGVQLDLTALQAEQQYDTALNQLERNRTTYQNEVNYARFKELGKHVSRLRELAERGEQNSREYYTQSQKLERGIMSATQEYLGQQKQFTNQEYRLALDSIRDVVKTAADRWGEIRRLTGQEGKLAQGAFNQARSEADFQRDLTQARARLEQRQTTRTARQRERETRRFAQLDLRAGTREAEQRERATRRFSALDLSAGSVAARQRERQIRRFSGLDVRAGTAEARQREREIRRTAGLQRDVAARGALSSAIQRGAFTSQGFADTSAEIARQFNITTEEAQAMMANTISELRGRHEITTSEAKATMDNTINELRQRHGITTSEARAMMNNAINELSQRHRVTTSEARSMMLNQIQGAREDTGLATRFSNRQFGIETVGAQRDLNQRLEQIRQQFNQGRISFQDAQRQSANARAQSAFGRDVNMAGLRRQGVQARQQSRGARLQNLNQFRNALLASAGQQEQLRNQFQDASIQTYANKVMSDYQLRQLDAQRRLNEQMFGVNQAGLGLTGQRYGVQGAQNRAQLGNTVNQLWYQYATQPLSQPFPGGGFVPSYGGGFGGGFDGGGGGGGSTSPTGATAGRPRVRSQSFGSQQFI